MANGEAPRRRALSVRLRLMLPIVITIAGMLVLGTIQVGQALNTNTDAVRARTMADLAEETAQLLQVGQNEIAATIESHQEGLETGARDLDEHYDRTDGFIEGFQERANEAGDVVPDLEPLLLTATGALEQMDEARENLEEYAEDSEVSRSEPNVDNGFGRYQSIADRVLDVGDALHQYISDHDLAGQVRALAGLSGAKQMAGNQRFLVTNMLFEAEQKEEAKIPAAALTDIATFRGIEQQRLGEFYRAADPRAKAIYANELLAPSTEQAERATRSLLDGGSVEVAASDWDKYQSDRIERLHEVESELTEHLADSAYDLELDARVNALTTGGIVLLVAVLTFSAAMVFAMRISRRLRVLRHDALSIAGEELPSAVASMTEARNENQVSEVAEAAQAATRGSRSGPNDEVAAVSAAFEVVHRQALRLAAEQATLRLDVSAMMVSLARRGQSLVQRQLHMLNEFTDAERDQGALNRMRQLQHVGTRMRRNDENLLLLAGGDPVRRHHHSISLGRAITEAGAEIEDSVRVVVEDSADTPIIAVAVGDLVHLLAELMENAALFSPPHTKVRVATRRTVSEAVISISDEGIGIPPDQVSEINDRLAEPLALTSSLAGTMGLLVVGRIASRHGIEVRLHSTVGKGTMAVVRLPEDVIDTDVDPDAGDLAERDPAEDLFLDPPDPGVMPVAPGAGPVEADESGAPTVPRPRIPHAGPGEAPVSGAPHQTGWFMPATGSGDVPALPPGSLSWKTSAGDRAYDQAREAITAVETATPSTDGSLPRRNPGSQLLPGSVDTTSAPSSTGQPGPFGAPTTAAGPQPGDGLDPDEIRARLAGFAGGIAAAAEASSDSQWPVGES